MVTLFWGTKILLPPTMTKSHHLIVCIPDFPFFFLRLGLVSHRENYRPYIFLSRVLLHYDQLCYFTFKESVNFKISMGLSWPPQAKYISKAYRSHREIAICSNFMKCLYLHRQRRILTVFYSSVKILCWNLSSQK